MIGSWYRNHEINKRSGIFTASGIAATMFSGYIQAGIYTSMNGALGLEGWRWLFIIGLEDNSQLLRNNLSNETISDFLISLPLLVFGIIFIPNPITSRARSWWMTYREKELALERLALDDRAPPGKLDLTIFKRVFGRWRFWIMASLTIGSYLFMIVSSDTPLEHYIFTLLLCISSTDHFNYGPLAESRKDLLRSANQQPPHCLFRHLHNIYDRIRDLQ